MAEEAKKPKAPAAKQPAAKAKSKVKNVWTMLEKSGDKVTWKNRSCPKCGQGFFMAKHKDRSTCGRCHYTEFSTSADAKK